VTGSPAFAAERHLDVREDIGRGGEPFRRIMAAADAIGPGEALVLRVPFEPVPLYKVLGARGFGHRAERRAPGDWWVWFYRDAASPSPAPAASPRDPAAPAPRDRRTVRLDVRGAEPPWPMVRVLEAMERLDPGDRLEVFHDRRPLFLYPQIDDRGFRHATDELEPGLIRIVIWREEPAA
jgi:uncharacterized protein (DUF2249 family)